MSIAHGQTESLIERAADVMLKQRRKLVLCLREAPLNLIHLRDMVPDTEAGATVYPLDPPPTTTCRKRSRSCGSSSAYASCSSWARPAQIAGSGTAATPRRDVSRLKRGIGL
ncbi:flavoprotein [Streptomyces sp. NPDC056352]|uniref:flavoprotein n=1 Tax=Streptomyces sp. NPDC056352 TaxID=3345791 RepID=UPI0035DD9A7D